MLHRVHPEARQVLDAHRVALLLADPVGLDQELGELDPTERDLGRLLDGDLLRQQELEDVQLLQPGCLDHRDHGVCGRGVDTLIGLARPQQECAEDWLRVFRKYFVRNPENENVVKSS